MNPIEMLMQLMPQQAQEPTLTHADMYNHIRRTPGLSEPYTASVMEGRNFTPPQDSNLRANQQFSEAAANLDFGKASALSRLLGLDIDPRVWLNESHGIAREQMRRYR